MRIMVQSGEKLLTVFSRKHCTKYNLNYEWVKRITTVRDLNCVNKTSSRNNTQISWMKSISKCFFFFFHNCQVVALEWKWNGGIHNTKHSAIFCMKDPFKSTKCYDCASIDAWHVVGHLKDIYSVCNWPLCINQRFLSWSDGDSIELQTLFHLKLYRKVEFAAVARPSIIDFKLGVVACGLHT